MKKYIQKGFTLIELLLVLVIISAFIVMGTQYLQQQAQNARIDKSALQLQYLLNAGLASYVANGGWPGVGNKVYTYSAKNVGGLQPDYIPNAAMGTPFGGYYSTLYYSSGSTTPPDNTFVAQMTIPGTTAYAQAMATIIAGKLPQGTTSVAGGGILIQTWVGIPGQSLGNATAVNFAGLYHQGACVPAPVCPNTSANGGGQAMVPQIFVVPVSVSGVNDEGSSNNIYPLSSFTAYAVGTDTDPAPCYATDTSAPACTSATPPPSGLYWRVCMQVLTERGNVQETRTDNWGNNVTMAAFTRCSIPNEPSGSDFTIYSH